MQHPQVLLTPATVASAPETTRSAAAPRTSASSTNVDAPLLPVVIALHDEARESLLSNNAQLARLQILLRQVPAVPSLAARIAHWLLSEKDAASSRWRWATTKARCANRTGGQRAPLQCYQDERLEVALADADVQAELLPLVISVLRVVMLHEAGLLAQQGVRAAQLQELCAAALRRQHTEE